MTRIAFIGFGEAAQAFVGSLREADASLQFSAYDILTEKGHDGAVRKAAADLGIALASEPASATRSADWVFSAVTAADSLDAAMSVAETLSSGQVFIDINSVSAGRKQETAKLVAASGAAYVDMAVMAPVHPRGHRTPSLLAGPATRSVREQMSALGFDVSVAGDDIGAATSIKMLRSLFVKGMEAVTVQTLLAAKAAGRFDEVYVSLAGSFARFGWPEFAQYQLERVATHGVRRAAEMRECAATQVELGFEVGESLANAIADVQQTIGTLGARSVAGDGCSDAYGRILDLIGRAPR